MSIGSGNRLLEISRANDMHFVYAFFFEYAEIVYVKVGESVSPYRRLEQVIHGCPFIISEAVFTHIGPSKRARNFESYVRHALDHRRLRGEWYMLPKSEGNLFADTMKEAYLACTRSGLKWSKIDLDTFMVGREGGSQPVALIGKGGRPQKPPISELKRLSDRLLGG